MAGEKEMPSADEDVFTTTSRRPTCVMAATQKRRLNLLDLPTDVLKDIVQNLTHTNDLTSTALVHSALHGLVTPIIYNRFDIVWPESVTGGDSRGGVDALTYGLATLTMAEDVFGEAAWQRDRARLRNGGAALSDRQIRIRRGNHYASYVRKFCLGNGPSDWIQEYHTHKESGKMLGTLVALALARMKSLESFIWDMPTGVLREVWISLSYLGDRQDGEASRLKKIWVRWHKNVVVKPFTIPAAVDHTVECITIDQTKALSRVEHPSFSILAPVRSLSVLDVDELQYLDEMSVLIGKSLEELRELRVSIASYCRRDDWAYAWTEDTYDQIDLSNPVRSTSTIGGRRRGGPLGVLTSAFLDLKQQDGPPHTGRPLRRRSGTISLVPSPSRNQSSRPTQLALLDLSTKFPETSRTDEMMETDAEDSLVDEVSLLTIKSEADSDKTIDASPLSEAQPCTPENVLQTKASRSSIGDSRPLRLQLDTLELERITLAIPVLKLALDWTLLTSLTILNCPGHELLWEWLHQEYAPDLRTSPPRRREAGQRRRSTVGEYGTARLHLKTIHVNNVLPSFVSFARDCLAPNTLESLFLQETDGLPPLIDIDGIFNSIIKRHKGSLKRLLVTCCKRKRGGALARSAAWKTWAFRQCHLTYVTSGRMSQLRELGMCVATSNDWHHFVRRLPGVPHLRSLYIPRYSTSTEDHDSTPREMAMHVLDAVTFNPTMELCYFGIFNKCYEIIDGEEASTGSGTATGTSMNANADNNNNDESDTSDDDMDDEDDDDDETDSADLDAEPDEHMVRSRTQQGSADRDSGAYEYEESDSEDDDIESHKAARLHLREILFYDDKVDIFRIRHGRL